MRDWAVVPKRNGEKGIIIRQHDNVISLPFEQIEEFMKHVFSAATGREFMGAHYTTPREMVGDE